MRAIVDGQIASLFASEEGKRQYNVVDRDNRRVYGPSLAGAGDYLVGLRFPTTLYNWRLQIAPKQAPLLESQRRNRRATDIALLSVALVVIVFGVFLLLFAASKERRAERAPRRAHRQREPRAEDAAQRRPHVRRAPAHQARAERGEGAAVPRDHRPRVRTAHGAHRERPRLFGPRARPDQVRARGAAPRGRGEPGPRYLPLPRRARRDGGDARGEGPHPARRDRRAGHRARAREPPRQRREVRPAHADHRDRRARPRLRATARTRSRAGHPDGRDEEDLRALLPAEARPEAPRLGHRARAREAHRRRPRRPGLGRNADDGEGGAVVAFNLPALALPADAPAAEETARPELARVSSTGS